LWEKITRRKVHPKFANVVIHGFAVLIISLFILLTFRDISMLWNWRKLFARQETELRADANTVQPADAGGAGGPAVAGGDGTGALQQVQGGAQDE
jgi:hypothetical protein